MESIKLLWEKKISKVVKLASLENFIKERPNGLNQIVGEKGVKISGGEKQRIGIARALYKKSSILLLDEATSALDQSTEKKVMSSISKYYKNLTIIMIAHRLSTVSICDKVLLLDKGSILKYGSPEEILTKN